MFTARLSQQGPDYNVCGDTGCTMSLIDRAFLQLRLPGIKIKQSDAELSVRGIGSRTHKCSKYVVITLFIPGTVNGKPALASITHQLHIVEDLQAKILIGIDILGPEQAIIDVGQSRLTLPLCNNLQANLTITPKQRQTRRVVLADKLITVPANSVASVPIRLRTPTHLPPEQDFLFQPILQGLNLGQQESPRAHIIDFNFTFVEVQNATDCPVVIPCKIRLGKVIDYEEESCYAISSKKTHLAAGAKWSKTSILPVIHDKSKATEPTETHQIGFTAYGTQEARSKLFAVAESYSIWAKAGGFIDIPEGE